MILLLIIRTLRSFRLISLSSSVFLLWLSIILKQGIYCFIDSEIMWIKLESALTSQSLMLELWATRETLPLSFQSKHFYIKTNKMLLMWTQIISTEGVSSLYHSNETWQAHSLHRLGKIIVWSHVWSWKWWQWFEGFGLTCKAKWCTWHHD